MRTCTETRPTGRSRFSNLCTISKVVLSASPWLNYNRFHQSAYRHGQCHSTETAFLRMLSSNFSCDTESHRTLCWARLFTLYISPILRWPILCLKLIRSYGVNQTHHHHFHYASLHLCSTPDSKLTFLINSSHHSLPHLFGLISQIFMSISGLNCSSVYFVCFFTFFGLICVID